MYALPDLDHDPGIASLVRGCQQATAAYLLAAVEPDRQHITIAQIGDQLTRHYTPGDMEEPTANLRDAVAVCDLVTVMLGSCLSSRYRLVLDMHPDEPLADLTRAVRSVIRSVHGPAADVYEPGVPHMSLAYANPRELHQMGASALAARSLHGDVRLRGAYSLTA